MRYRSFAAERIVSGAVVERWDLQADSRAKALRETREIVLGLPSRKAYASIVRVVAKYAVGFSSKEAPIGAFRRSGDNRVSRV